MFASTLCRDVKDSIRVIILVGEDLSYCNGRTAQAILVLLSKCLSAAKNNSLKI